MENNEALDQISKKLSILIALQLQDGESIKVQGNVEKLSRFNLSTREIAEILGTTPDTVKSAKKRLKNNNSKKTKK